MHHSPSVITANRFWIGTSSSPDFSPVFRVVRTPLIHSVLTHTVLFPKLLFAMADCRWQQIAMGGCHQPALGWKAGVGSMCAKCGLANTERCPSFRGGVPASRLFQREGEGFHVCRPFSLGPILLFFAITPFISLPLLITLLLLSLFFLPWFFHFIFNFFFTTL